MFRVRLIIFLAITLCFVSCLCTHALVSKEEAEKAAEGAQEAAKDLLDVSERRLGESKYILERIEIYKEDAEQAASDAESTATGNQEAEVAAEKAKSASDEIVKLYPKAYAEEVKCRNDIVAFNKKARDLYVNAMNLCTSEKVNANYTHIKENAEDVNSKVKSFEMKLKEMSLFGEEPYAQRIMRKLLEETLLAKYHVDAIVAVANISFILKVAQGDIQSIEQMRDEVNVTLTNMNELYEKLPSDVSKRVELLSSLAKRDFTSAERAVDRAKRANEDIQELKKEVDKSLKQINSAATIYDAEVSINTIGQFSYKLSSKTKEIENALDTAKISTQKIENKWTEMVTKLYEKKHSSDARRDEKYNSLQK